MKRSIIASRFALWSLIPAVLVTSCSNERYPGPMTPEKSLEHFELHEDFEIEIFATEPHVQDPVSMIFDENGNAYVVEMPDYPFKPEPGQGKGRIKLLRDTDGDGKVDSSTVFAENISEATSMLPWKGGIILTAAPHILYLKDTDGDHVADVQEKLFSGFFENNSEAQITNLRFGVDNWIYASNHGQAGNVTFSKKPDAPALSMAGADFRFRLDRDEFEAETGPGQFGHALNDWGHRFFTQNTLHIQQSVIPWRYNHRHPYLPSSRGSFNINDHDLRMYQLTPTPYWREERSSRRQASYDEQGLDRIEHPRDHFTGASGGTFYGGDAFPEGYYGNIFTGEVAGNLVHRDILVPHKTEPRFIAQRAEGEGDREFLASTDTWFRPSNFTVGPDGNLYLIDMYRQHIETPVSIPEDLKEDMDFMRGSDMGRIYRIVSKEKKTGKLVENASNPSAQEYVELLSHPNQWWRLQAQRLLLERQDKSIIPAVTALFNDSEDPRTRLHALYVLEGLNSLSSSLVQQAIGDEHPGVREHGVILAERFPDLLPQLISLTEDSDPRVAFQATLSIGEFSSANVAAALAKVVEQRNKVSWFRTAVLSSNIGSSMQLVSALDKTQFFGQVDDDKKKFANDLAYVFGARNAKGEAAALIKAIANKDPEWHEAYLNGLLKGLEKSESENKVDSDLESALSALESNTSDKNKEIIGKIKSL